MLDWTRRFAQDHPVIWLLVCSVVFGVPMGSRTEFSEPWQRALVAAAAGAVLCLTIAPMRFDSGSPPAM